MVVSLKNFLQSIQFHFALNLKTGFRNDSTVNVGKKFYRSGKWKIQTVNFLTIYRKKRPNKFRKFETLVGEMLTGTNLNSKELIRRIVVEGYKTTLYLQQQNWQNYLYCVDLKTSLGIQPEESFSVWFSKMMSYHITILTWKTHLRHLKMWRLKMRPLKVKSVTILSQKKES